MREELPEVSVSTTIGDRQYQQDMTEVADNDGMLCAVLCDGMGGMSSGEVAAEIGVGVTIQNFQENPPSDMKSVSDWLRGTFQQADLRVSMIEPHDSDTRAGSTIIAVLIKGMLLQWGCVGDSRIYLLRQGTIDTLTRMHNYRLHLEHQLRIGDISEEFFQNENVRGDALISFLGIGGLPLIDIGAPIQLLPGDIVLMCSDGLYHALDDQQIQAIVEESGGNVSLISERLIYYACRLTEGILDNTTVIAIRAAGS